MDWCERCGRYFVRRTGKPLVHGIAARGVVVTDPSTSVCSGCLKYGEWIDETGVVRTGPKEENG